MGEAIIMERTLYSIGRKYVRRPIWQRFNALYSMKTVKCGGPRILIWGLLRVKAQKSYTGAPQYLILRNTRKFWILRLSLY